MPDAPILLIAILAAIFRGVKHAVPAMERAG
jgi:hypothetical protein